GGGAGERREGPAQGEQKKDGKSTGQNGSRDRRTIRLQEVRSFSAKEPEHDQREKRREKERLRVIDPKEDRDRGPIDEDRARVQRVCDEKERRAVGHGNRATEKPRHRVKEDLGG